MTHSLDINTLASWATVAVAAAAGVGFIRKGQRWFDKTDERLEGLESSQAELGEAQAALGEGQAALVASQADLSEGQAALVASQAKLEDGQAAVTVRLDTVEAQLRPNGGNSHHDVLRREIREAIEEAAENNGRRRWHR